MKPQRRVTQLLQEWGAGDVGALNTLISIVHNELQKIARQHIAREHQGHTLQPTDLVSEAYLRLLEIDQVQWQDREHFFAVAAQVMRRVLIDAGRARGAHKRGDGVRPASLDDAEQQVNNPRFDLFALEEALQKLETVDPRKARIVQLRFFVGLSVQEVATLLRVSEETVKRDWRLGKAWLWRVLSEGTPNASSTARVNRKCL
jgi:RNA polymerase sigma factor (TIGR02999 family)